ncbi:SAM domain-containing protein, partial [Aphis craccivora]
ATLSNEIELGPCDKVISDIDVQLLQLFLNIEPLNALTSCPWVAVKGTRYQLKMILTLDIVEYDFPKFGIIDKIYFYNNLIIFQCFKFNTIMFDEHYHCFEVEKVINEPIFVKHNMLASHIPNHICTMSNGKNYITVRVFKALLSNSSIFNNNLKLSYYVKFTKNCGRSCTIFCKRINNNLNVTPTEHLAVTRATKELGCGSKYLFAYFFLNTKKKVRTLTNLNHRNIFRVNTECNSCLSKITIIIEYGCNLKKIYFFLNTHTSGNLLTNHGTNLKKHLELHPDEYEEFIKSQDKTFKTTENKNKMNK